MVHVHTKEAAECHRTEASYVTPDTSELRNKKHTKFTLKNTSN